MEFCKMKKFLAILINKILYRLGKLLKRGSSKPGQVALKICPNILSLVKLPKDVIVVTRK